MGPVRVCPPSVQVKVVAPLAVRVVLWPAHSAGWPAPAVMTGKAFTVTVTVAVLVQPLALAPVTVYVVV